MPSPWATASADLCQAYEALRAHAIGPPSLGAAPRGLMLFLRGGLAGWMRALTALTPAPSPRTNGHQPAGRSESTAELILVLAQMALSTGSQPTGVNA